MISKIEFIAQEAGKIIRQNFGKKHEIRYKSNFSDLVTETDRKSESVILNFISKEFPTHSILSEESGQNNRTSEYLWVVDPLDGTTNFAHGLPIFSVSIAVLKNNETIYGVVYDVMRDVLYSAEKGSGAFANGKSIYVSNRRELEKCMLVTGFPYDFNGKDSVFTMFESFLKKSRAVRRLGSAAIDCCLVAEGVFDGFWEATLFPWDVLAGKVIIEEAGGKVTDFNNDPLTLELKQFLGTNNLIHEKMLHVINDI